MTIIKILSEYHSGNLAEALKICKAIKQHIAGELRKLKHIDCADYDGNWNDAIDASIKIVEE